MHHTHIVSSSSLSGHTGAAWVALRNETAPTHISGAFGGPAAVSVSVEHLGRRLVELAARFTPLHAAFIRVVMGFVPAATALALSLRVG